jgi:Protein of unknown function (DUF1344)
LHWVFSYDDEQGGNLMRKTMGAVLLAGVLATGTASAADLEGKIQMVKVDERVVILEDGKQVWIAEGISMEELKEGRLVKVAYEERDGKVVAVSIEVVK